MTLSRRWAWFILAFLGFTAPATAADRLAFAPPAPWIVPTELGRDRARPAGAALSILLVDQQLRLTPESDDEYVESATRIQNPQGLQAMGTIAVAWNPDLNTVTIHKLHIIRGGEVIDVLATGQTFTVLRRETNLESATLDGTLTAAIQPGGLQIGDIVDFAYTISNTDPVFRGISEWRILADDPLPIARLRIRAQWPGNLPIRWQASPAITGLKQRSVGGMQSVTYAVDNAEPLAQVNGAPARYVHERRIDFTQFASWAAISRHFAPLYVKAAALAPQSALKIEIDRIRADYSKPQDRAGAALALVQDQVRYVFLGMNDGGLVPAGADLTWSRRFGDCKGKTVLLLALLRGLGIEADPVLVSTSGGDGLNARLPVVSDFDHVLVRARIGGSIYWLDGTRTGDRTIAGIAVPAFDWGLPLMSDGSDLVAITPQPLSQPSEIQALRIDASKGLHAPAPVHAELALRGDAATSLRLRLANLSQADLDHGLRRLFAGTYGFVDIKSVGATYDQADGAERLTMEGVAPLQLPGHLIETQILALAANRVPDFSRAPGPDQDAPFAVPFPFYTRNTETILLPDGGAGYNVQGQDVDRVAGGVAYKRSVRIEHGKFIGEATERALMPEFPAAEAVATTNALRELAQSAVVIRRSPQLAPSGQDPAATRRVALTAAAPYLNRGSEMLNKGDFDTALSDFNEALAIDPRSIVGMALRGLTYAWKGDEKRARQDIAAASAIDPTYPVMLRARGSLAMDAGHEREAIAAFTQSLDNEPNNVFALVRRAAAYVAAGNDDKALADTATVLRIQPQAYKADVIRADILRRRGFADQAAAEARAITTAVPADAQAHVAAAEIYRDLHRRADAMREFDLALSIKPSAATYLRRAGSRDGADFAGKRADIQAALNSEPHNKAALAALAHLQSGAGDHTAAAATLSTALASHANDPELLALRGIEYLKSNLQALATQDFNAAKAAATTAHDDNTICWSKATAGVALRSALEDCEAALSEAPGHVNYLDSEGLVLLRLSRYEDAIGTYSKVLALRPMSPSSLFGRGIAERRRGDVKAANLDLAMARSIEPDVDNRFSEFGLSP